VKSASVNDYPNTSEVGMVGVKLIGITKSDNGDAIYELTLTPQAQEQIFQEMEEFDK
jgi:hypothetical protein